MKKKQFEEYFMEHILPYVATDRPARDQAWNDTIDALIKEKELKPSAGDWTKPNWLFKK